MVNLIILALFLPASIGLFWEALSLVELSSKLIAIAFLIFCLEQARMAITDYKSYKQVQKLYKDSRLLKFKKILIITIIIELMGFYTANFQLGLGAILVLLSQILFNCFAGIRFNNNNHYLIIENGSFSERKIELLADLIALLLISCWMLNIYSLAIAITIILIIAIYALVKIIEFMGKFTPLTLPNIYIINHLNQDKLS